VQLIPTPVSSKRETSPHAVCAASLTSSFNFYDLEHTYAEGHTGYTFQSKLWQEVFPPGLSSRPCRRRPLQSLGDQGVSFGALDANDIRTLEDYGSTPPATSVSPILDSKRGMFYRSSPFSKFRAQNHFHRRVTAFKGTELGMYGSMLTDYRQRR